MTASDWDTREEVLQAFSTARLLLELRRRGQATFASLRAANTVRQQEWDPDSSISLEYRGNELGGECGEAQNEIKKLARERLGIRGSRTTLAKLAEELADVVICVDLICMAEDIDLAEAVKKKFNATSEKLELKTRI